MDCPDFGCSHKRSRGRLPCTTINYCFYWRAGVALKQKHVIHIQAILYHVEVHPFKTWVKQCTPAGALESAEAEVAYALCRLLAFPFLPFTLTLFYYLRIWQKLSTMAVAGWVSLWNPSVFRGIMVDLNRVQFAINFRYRWPGHRKPLGGNSQTARLAAIRGYFVSIPHVLDAIPCHGSVVSTPIGWINCGYDLMSTRNLCKLFWTSILVQELVGPWESGSDGL